MRVGLVLMTAIVPTIGHKFLIDYASKFYGIDRLVVIVSTRQKEPTSFEERVSHLGGSNVVFYNHFDDNAPQHPNPDYDFDYLFWKYWENVIKTACETTCKEYEITHVFASEMYGKTVADLFRASFIPVDVKRETYDVRGTDVRNSLFENANKIVPGFVKDHEVKVVLFGQESVGKTTMAKELAHIYNGTFYPEWARGYLETVGAELSPEKMKTIFHGQLSLEQDEPIHANFFKIHDTDLLSTYGYYKLLAKQYGKKEYESDMKQMKVFFKLLGDYFENKTYIVLADHIPFEKDILRYGGNKRETNLEFWIDILNEFQAKYVVIYSSDMEERKNEIHEKLKLVDANYEKLINIKEYVRDQ